VIYLTPFAPLSENPEISSDSGNISGARSVALLGNCFPGEGRCKSRWPDRKAGKWGLIALLIAYVAIENIFLSELKPWRIALVLTCGLLHGLGFAGALKELGLPRSEFVTALLTFNIGVEGGQLAVIAAAFLIVGWHCSHRAWYCGRIVVPASAVIACIAVYWTMARLYA
jgi:hypothetical protein